MLTYIITLCVYHKVTEVIVPNCIIYNVFFVINLNVLFLVFNHFIYLSFFFFNSTTECLIYYVNTICEINYDAISIQICIV